MEPAIFTSFDSSLSLAQAAALIRDAGFRRIAIGAGGGQPGYLTAEGRAEIRRLVAQHNLGIDSVHAPFPDGDRLFAIDEAERLDSVRLCKTALEAAAELDGRVVVIHLIQPYGIPAGPVRDRMVNQGRRSVATLADHAAQCQVKLALENGQRDAYDQVLVDLLTEFDVPHVGLCYDSGHENVRSACFGLLERFGHRLFALHVHDNEGADTHVLPGEGTIDWQEFRRVVHGLDFTGDLLIEAGTRNSEFKAPVVFLAEAYRRAQALCQANSASCR
jgi:sugar phosphate isomerase/epimerase